MTKIGKEIVVFVGLFLFLALGMHMKQWISHPIEHIEHLSQSQFGLFHPLYFTFGLYIILYIIRKILSFLRGLFALKS
ncbi:hypothetical protein [Sulfurospirillum arcachonense]|uniref:hypothetical protein n=1 Tax=Sulfurospirillum arcachonense TaxID=57666 RepID=UPI000469D9FB|nr:hypothetical protein [Sulfurospirillum arcachonense]